MGFSKTKGTMYRSLVSEERPVRIQFWHNFHPLEMIDIKMIWADILIFISFLVTKAPSEGQPSSFIKTDFGHYAQKKKNRLYSFFAHKNTLIFPRLFSHPWKVCLWQSLAWKVHQNYTLRPYWTFQNVPLQRAGNSKILRDQPLPLVPPLGLLLLAQLVLANLALAAAAPPIAAQLLVVVAPSLVVVLPTTFVQIVAPPAPSQLLEEKVIGGSIDFYSQENLRFSVLISEHFPVSRFKYKLPWQRQRFDKDINRALQPWSPF